jgi:hypothetical protein
MIGPAGRLLTVLCLTAAVLAPTTYGDFDASASARPISLSYDGSFSTPK